MRSLWIGTLAAALSCSTPGWSQMLQADRWIMVREEGKPAVKCRVVSTKKMKDGSTLCQAKTESGETITLLEEAVTGMPAGTLRMRVLPGVARLPAETHLAPAPSPVPTPTVLPTVVHAKPERTSLFGKLFHSSPSNPEVATPVAKPPVEHKEVVAVKVATPAAKPPVEHKEVVAVKPEVKPEPKREPVSAIGRLFLSTPSKPEVVTKAEKVEGEKKLVVEAKPEAKQEPAPTAGGLLLPTPSKSEAVATVEKKEPVGKPPVELPVVESRPQLPVSKTSADDPLNRPEFFTKQMVSGPALPEPPLPAIPSPVAAPAATPTVTTTIETEVVSSPAPVLRPAEPRPGVMSWFQSKAAPKPPVVPEPKEVTPSLLDRLRTQLPTATSSRTVAAPPAPRPFVPNGMGSVLATRDRAIMGQSVGGAMVRTPTGAMAFVPADHMPQGPNVVPISASNAFTLGMPGYAPGMPGSMPMMAMQQAPVSYQQGVPEGAANAFTTASTSRPVPADIGPPPQYPNAFLADGMGGAYTRPMALSYDPRMGYLPVAGGYPEQHPMLPMPHPAAPMLAMLRCSIMPSERERAVQMLSQCNWHTEPEAVAAITLAAKSDPAPTVRVSCVRALARMKVGTMPVYETLQELKADQDPRVRLEAEQTLATMTRH